jgi:hypothetical protein
MTVQPQFNGTGILLQRSYNASLDSILENCGEICHTNISGTPGKFFEALVKKVDCMAILTNPALDASMLEKEPPSQIPPHLLNAYTYDGKVAVRYVATRNERHLGAQVGCKVAKVGTGGVF